MVRDLPFYLPNVDPKELEVHAAATESKSWTAHGLDVVAEIERADAIDLRFGIMLRLMYAFGYRCKECLLCDPWVTDNIHTMAITPSMGKGNRSRNIPFDSPGQRQIIEYIKTIVKKGEVVGWCEPNGQPKDFKKNYQRFGNLMTKMGHTKNDSGVTGHCLRSEYAEDAALALGYIPATLGGTENQMSKEDFEIAKKQVSERLGHSRDATASYCGGLKLMKENSKRLRDAAALKLKIINNPKKSLDSDKSNDSDDDLITT